MKKVILINDLGISAEKAIKFAQDAGVDIVYYEDLSDEEKSEIDGAMKGRDVGNYASKINDIVCEKQLATDKFYRDLKVQDQFPNKKGGKKNKRNNWNRR